jgi:DNA-binding transcriptional LysR family regulator
MPPAVDPRLKLRHLSLAVAIDETGSLRKAADRLHITQAAASHLLSELEFIIGAPLFARSRSGTRPTTIGTRLVERARPILSNIRAATEEVQQVGDGQSGDVYVGVLHAAAMTIIPLAVQVARKDNPGIRLHLIEGPSQQHLDSLLRGDLDLVVGRVPPAQVSGLLHKEVLLVEPIEVVCRAGHPLALKARLELADALTADWILPESGSSLRDDFSLTFTKANLEPPEPAIVTSSTVVRLSLIEGSDMLGVLPRRSALAHEHRGSLKILDFGLMFSHAPTLLLTRVDAIFSPAATAFVRHVRSAADQLTVDV